MHKEVHTYSSLLKEEAKSDMETKLVKRDECGISIRADVIRTAASPGEIDSEVSIVRISDVPIWLVLESG